MAFFRWRLGWRLGPSATIEVGHCQWPGERQGRLTLTGLTFRWGTWTEGPNIPIISILGPREALNVAAPAGTQGSSSLPLQALKAAALQAVKVAGRGPSGNQGRCPQAGGTGTQSAKSLPRARVKRSLIPEKGSRTGGVFGTSIATRVTWPQSE